MKYRNYVVTTEMILCGAESISVSSIESPINPLTWRRCLLSIMTKMSDVFYVLNYKEKIG